MGEQFRALIVEENKNGTYSRQIGTKSISDLPAGEVLVKVKYSSLNYKDALSAIGNKGVTRKYPHTPGIDAAGIVEESEVDEIRPGKPVIVTSYDLGMNTSGGFGQFIRVPAEWVVKLPENLSLKESMMLGTAGFTAGLSVYRILKHAVPASRGKIVVTGATGGVGSLAVAILSKMGYHVVAATGKTDQTDFLDTLKPSEIIDRSEVIDESGKPILKKRWAAAIDTVGGQMLSSVIRSMENDGPVTCCGNAASHELDITVYPFILRGVTLYGIDSQNCPYTIRQEIWNKLADEWKPEILESLAFEIGLGQLSDQIDRMLNNRQTGRAFVNLEK
jgi:putative YhdH/YhfP family quinone oxidoreductase